MGRLPLSESQFHRNSGRHDSKSMTPTPAKATSGMAVSRSVATCTR